MSKQLFEEDVLFTQRFLRSQDLYDGGLDGDWGPITEAGWQTFEEFSENVLQETYQFESRSEGHIRTMVLNAQFQARLFLARLLDAGHDARIISGTRSYAEQDALYRKGRWGNPGPRVTNARGGHSAHNFGIAWDIGLFDDIVGYITDADVYIAAAEFGKTEMLFWGGDWQSFVDPPHYHFRFQGPLSAMRTRFEQGEVQFEEISLMV